MQNIYTTKQTANTTPWLKNFTDEQEASRHVTLSGDLPLYVTRKGFSRFAASKFSRLPMKFGNGQIPRIKAAFPKAPVPCFEYGGRITARPEEFACFAILTMDIPIGYSQMRFYFHYRLVKALRFQRILKAGKGIPYDDKVEVGMLDTPEAFDREYETLFRKFQRSNPTIGETEKLYKEFLWYRSLITKTNKE